MRPAQARHANQALSIARHLNRTIKPGHFDQTIAKEELTGFLIFE
jgi:hypothetical protein